MEAMVSRVCISITAANFGLTMMMGSPAAQAAGLDCQPRGHGVGFDSHTNMSLI